MVMSAKKTFQTKGNNRHNTMTLPDWISDFEYVLLALDLKLITIIRVNLDGVVTGDRRLVLDNDVFQS